MKLFNLVLMEDLLVEAEVAKEAKDGKLPCAKALSLASKLGVAPSKIGETANKLKVKIVGCQLGCFK